MNRYLKYLKVIPLFVFTIISGLANLVHADLVITPVTPVVEVGQSITLTVSEANGGVTWIAELGQIKGNGAIITYVAPNEAGIYAITALSGTDVRAVQVKVIEHCDTCGFSRENAVWEIFTQRPTINALAFSPDKSILWVNTINGIEQWETSTGQLLRIYTSDDLPDSFPEKIFADNSNNIWQNAGNDLLQFKANDDGIIFQADNAVLPNNIIQALVQDSEKKLWVKTANGFIYREESGDWATLFLNSSELPPDILNLLNNTDESSETIVDTTSLKLPSNNVLSQLSDSNGTWLGTDKGLFLLDSNNELVVFNTDNSGLPHDVVNVLKSDNKGGLWVGTQGGLGYLTFGQKSSIINKITKEEPEKEKSLRNALFREKRAAIFIHPQSQGGGHHQNFALEFMANYAYRNLYIRGYDNNEIYFLSHKPDLDFNGDARPDFYIVDAPVTLAEFRNNKTAPRNITITDIQTAFNSAKNKGQLDYPLFVIFIGHGLSGKLSLDSLNKETLKADTFKAILDDYQNSTGNQVVVIIEAAHSGTLISTLAGPNRVIMTSTGDGFAYYQDLGRTSFLKLFADQMRKGETLWDTRDFIEHTFSKYQFPFNQQIPQLEDNADGMLAQNICLNGCFGGLPGVLTLIVQPFGQINPGQPIDFTLEANLDEGGIHRVWSPVMTPEIAQQYNEQGFSLLPMPTVQLSQHPLIRSKDSSNQWHGQFSGFNTTGDYLFTFKAIDNKGIITESEPVNVFIELSKNAYFNSNTNILHIPAVKVGTETFQADLTLHSVEPTIILELNTTSVKLASDNAIEEIAHFESNTGAVDIPLLDIPNTSGSMDTFSVDLQLVPQTSPLQFRVENITPQ
ncbi:two-component regulator propeller domain-containing protein [Candidatus Parabeggiatoa sp. HSG14]|uniref:two-component regulator propeller domain-containing protein n=1 Tax=Candidatus Parabeggiatoa sp. HSG14 TaxID=3055593 RepID=UPI0025A74354|nr:C13 family peptidase [Thiotrichales bacterium HSG14]